MPDCMIAQVAVENTAFHFDMEFSYRIPVELSAAARPGCRVLVPFGTSGVKKRQGMILDVCTPDSVPQGTKLKAIAQVLDSDPVLNAEGIRMVRFLKERTFCTLYEAVRAVLPSGIGRRIVVSYCAVPAQALPPDRIPTDQERSVLSFCTGGKALCRVQGDRCVSAVYVRPGLSAA